MTDVAARQQALDPSQSFICEAPAGSGKTELLIQRFLQLLAHVDRPEEILAISFTRKAAEEVRTRIIDAIDNASTPPPELAHQRCTWNLAQAVVERDHQLGWNILQNPQRLEIRTFDSLCAKLANALPVAAQFSGQATVAEHAEPIYRDAVRSMFEDLSADESWGQALLTLLESLDNNYLKLEQLLIAMLSKRDAWLPLISGKLKPDAVKQQLEKNLQQVVASAICKVAAQIPEQWKTELLALAEYAATQVVEHKPQSPVAACLDMGLNPNSSAMDAHDLKPWLGLRELLLTAAGKWRKSLNKNIGFPSGKNAQEKRISQQMKARMQDLMQKLQTYPALRESLHQLDQLPAVKYSPEQWKLLNAISVLLPVTAAYLNLQFRALCRVDFLEVAIRAREALGEIESPSDLALRLDYSIRHILVDEFQDTSLSQYSLLVQLLSGWEAGDGRTLFLVGNSMQSIYRFRDAQVGLMLHSKQHGIVRIPLQPLQLRSNFRSCTNVVQWINHAFSRTFPQRDDITTGAVSYTESIGMQPSTADSGVYVHTFARHTDPCGQANKIVELVAECLSKPVVPSIAILVRNRNHARPIAQALRKAGIAYWGVDLEALADQQVVLDLMALTRALLDVADRIAWLSVMRAPWCGLRLADLQALTYADAPTIRCALTQQLASTETTLSTDGLQRLRRVGPILLEAVAQQQRLPLRQWVEGTWIQLGGSACLQDVHQRHQAQAFFTALQELDPNDDASQGPALQQLLERLYAAADPHTDVKVHMMTMHKAKGLEFDVVILPSLERRTRRGDAQLLLWQQRVTAMGHSELLMAPISAVGEANNSIYSYLDAQHKLAERWEAMRLLYVACTRARSQLHLLASLQNDEQGHLLPPSADAGIAPLWESIETNVPSAPDQYPQPPLPSTPQPASIRRLPADYALPQLTERYQLAAYAPPSRVGDLPLPQITWADPQPRHVGIVVHEALMASARCGSSRTVDLSSRALQRWYRRLKQLGTPIAALDKAVAEVHSILQSAAEDEIMQWLLAAEHKRIEAEYALTHWGAEGPRDLVIDLFFEQHDGKAWVVDYKTSSPQPHEPQQAFLRRQIALYRPQLQAYLKAVHALGYHDLHAGLYFPALKAFARLEAPF